MNSHRVAIFGLALYASACSKDPPKQDQPSQPAATTSIQAASSSANAPDPGPIPPMNMASIPERFANEAAHRPKGTVRVEDVFDAFTKAGVTLREQRQHLASPFKAKYCVGAQAGHDLHMSICEYDDDKTAMEGRQMSEKAFATIARRDLYQNKATTLTIRRNDNDSGDVALRDKLVDLFNKVPAPAATAPAASK